MHNLRCCSLRQQYFIFYLKFEQKTQDEKRKKEDAEKQNRAEQEKSETEAAERAKKEVSSVDPEAKDYQNNQKYLYFIRRRPPKKNFRERRPRVRGKLKRKNCKKKTRLLC